MAVQSRRVSYNFWTLVVASLMLAGLNGCGGGGGGAAAPVVASAVAVAPVAPREVGIRQFVGSVLGERSTTAGFVDGQGMLARFNDPHQVVADLLGNLYVVDSSNSALRKVTAAGMVTTVTKPAGPGDPRSVAVDASGNLILVDTEYRVQKITPAGAVTTLAMPPDQLDAGALSARAISVAADKQGNIYLAYDVFHKLASCKASYGPPTECPYIDKTTLHKVSPSGTWTTLATSDNVYRTADGSGHLADFVSSLGAMAVDAAGTLYVSDFNHNTIIKITAAGVVTTFAGTPGVAGAADGVGAAASFKLPFALAVDAAGNLYVDDRNNFTIRKITPAGSVTTVAGAAGKEELVPGSLPGSLSRVGGMAVDANGDLVLSVPNGLIKVGLP